MTATALPELEIDPDATLHVAGIALVVCCAVLLGVHYFTKTGI